MAQAAVLYSSCDRLGVESIYPLSSWTLRKPRRCARAPFLPADRREEFVDLVQHPGDLEGLGNEAVEAAQQVLVVYIGDVAGDPPHLDPGGRAVRPEVAQGIPPAHHRRLQVEEDERGAMTTRE